MDVHVFKSLDHPGSRSRGWTFTTALVRPLMVCMLPVMIGALIAVLQGVPALRFLTIGAPVAVGLAVGWTFYRLHASPAEVHVRPGAAAVFSLWETTEPSARRLRWLPILELRTSRTSVVAAIGDAAYELDRSRWPEADTLLATLRAARDAGVG